MSKPLSEEIVLYPFSGKQIEFLVNSNVSPSIVKAVLMVKANLNDADGSALITKTIYATGNEHGIITADLNSEGSYVPLLIFTITPIETQNLVIGARLFTSLKVWNGSTSAPASPAKGRRGVRVEAPGVYTTSPA
jgi:hypothetical protein